MTAPTDELAQALRGAAADILDRSPVLSPDPQDLWKRARRRRWASRAAAAGLVAAAVALVTTVGLVMRPGHAALPADSSSSRYPEFVSELFPGRYAAGPQPVFGYVMVLDPSSTQTFVIHRSGLLSRVPGDSPLTTSGTLAPDGLHVLTADGIVDLSDGSLVRPMSIDPDIGSGTRRGARGHWSPDSAHVLVSTSNGPAVIDLLANASTRPVAGSSDAFIMPAGWRDASTVLGVRTYTAPGQLGLEVVARGLSDDTWTTVAAVDDTGVESLGAPTAVDASPDGSRLLLRYRATSGAAAGPAILVDAASGERLPFAGQHQLSVAEWDACDPVWQDNQPLLAAGGLRRPGDTTPVMRFSGRLDLGCVALAGAELTGTPDPRSALVLRERVWRVALPVLGAIALIGAVWVVVALRRSRRLERPGKRWLPAILTRPF